MAGIQPNMQLTFVLEIPEKSDVKHSIEKPALINFVIPSNSLVQDCSKKLHAIARYSKCADINKQRILI